MMITNIAASTEPHRGWGGPIAIAAAFVGIWLIHLVVKAIDARRSPSPTPDRPRGQGVNAQVSQVADTDDTSWWGQILDLGNGVRVRRFRAVLATGSSRLPEDRPGRDEELDLDLDQPTAEEPETLEGWIDERLDQLGYADLVRAGMARWRVSESTMKRRIADARRD